MAQLAPIVLNDGTNDVTFQPYDIDSTGKALFRTSAESVIAGLELSVWARDAKTNRRVTMALTVPVVQTEIVNGISTPKVVRRAFATVELISSKSSLTTEREAVLTLGANMLQNALIASVVKNNESLY